MILEFEKFKTYIDKFNRNDENCHPVLISNNGSSDWMQKNIPLFECPDEEIEETYYFRWWTYRKHIKYTPFGYIVDEFLPDVPWAGNYNSINASANHHLYEGRWLKNAEKYLEKYCEFWFRYARYPRMYSSWLEDSIYNFCKVRGDFSLAIRLLPEMINDYHEWEVTNLNKSGLFWSHDGYDAMEFSISGHGLRPTLNSYMYANAKAIAEVAEMAGDHDNEVLFSAKAEKIKKLMQDHLWDPKDEFFKVIPLETKDEVIEDWSFRAIDPDHNVREEIGFIPWYFNLPDDGYEIAWKQIMDENGFYAPFGPTTAERRHRRFMFEHDEHECLWNGPSWPYATSQTLKAMSNVLVNYDQRFVDCNDFYKLLKIYTHCHYRTLKDGSRVNWIDENIHPFTGVWLAREILEKWNWREDKGGYERGKDYNHSEYCDIIISDLIGLRPRKDDILEIVPLIPEDQWDYFCLDEVPYHGRLLSLVYDKKGKRYGMKAGFSVYADGKELYNGSKFGHIKIQL